LRPVDADPEKRLTRNSKPPEFEQALDELEKLVERLERGDLPLDEALRTFERGVELTRHCQTALKAAQQRVEILLRRGGRTEIEPFAVSDEESGAGMEPQRAPVGPQTGTVADPASEP
jgi:exodeoxyribonuclease VII small subunit